MLNSNIIYYLHNDNYLENLPKNFETTLVSKSGKTMYFDVSIFPKLNNIKEVDGDKLIKSVAEVLKNNFDNNSIISRFGGDEFVILIDIQNLDGLKKLYLQMVSAFEEYNIYNKNLPIEISTGYSFSETSLDVVEHTFNIADKNMYKHKNEKKRKGTKFNLIDLK